MQVAAECAELQSKVSLQQLNDQYDGERAALIVQLRAKLREATTARDMLKEQLVHTLHRSLCSHPTCACQAGGSAEAATEARKAAELLRMELDSLTQALAAEKAAHAKLREALAQAQGQLKRSEDEREHFRVALFASLGDRQQLQRREAEMELERSSLATQLKQHGLTKADVTNTQFNFGSNK